MKIGIDATVLQGPHRMRGIGYTLINFINHLPKEAKTKHHFVLYLYEQDKDQALNLLELKGVNHSIVSIPNPLANPRRNKLKHIAKQLGRFVPAIIKAPFKVALHQFRIYKDYYLGDTRLGSLRDIDKFIQFNQEQHLPRHAKGKVALVLYDMIPYVMEADYLLSYSTARNKGCTRRSALNHALHRRQYKSRLKFNCKRADYLLAISKHTKKDFVTRLSVPAKKIQVCLLGVDGSKTKKTDKDPQLHRYTYTSWGTIPRKLDLNDKKFLLFLGGADPRRKLVDLVAAFNNLRAQGHDIKLVLAGDTSKGPFDIPVPALQDYFRNTSYLDDVYFLGFVEDYQREWLYKHAVAFVYPSVYEGFGLPVLEAMRHGTPVITYRNTSILEVAEDAAIYADDFMGITRTVRDLVSNSTDSSKFSLTGKKQAKKFGWNKTADSIIRAIKN
ncbi:MAG: glycosyltransferase family 1 protein [Candidatus Saccharibacteria bacterium]|nr:glycosyltransferase family 1 protein [Candidatus Saccharibacteria bacterium]